MNMTVRIGPPAFRLGATSCDVALLLDDFVDSFAAMSARGGDSCNQHIASL